MESPLRKWRESFGISQADLADISGVNRTHISDIENGHAVIGEKLEAYLEKTGGDALELKEKQDKYMRFVKEELQAKIESKG